MQYLCDLFSRFQGVAAPRSRCAACWRPRTSISRIKSEIFERPKIPHRPARQSRQPTPTTTTSCNKFARLGGYWVRKPPDSFDVLKKRQGTPGPARFWGSGIKSLAARPTSATKLRGPEQKLLYDSDCKSC
ncbi:hypothetical protein N657DRAFT_370748 [Parathielavia appendiculata]|uniref:Uncharacterized protein n=1 Tax=Parathielavia appendiculata TaxID=2587402 RepID=A0AAN6TQQ8_9PEZI|nr:hypothetical protein N657DRAFT_370748 [Parathielavia appendiculata]